MHSIELAKRRGDKRRRPWPSIQGAKLEQGERLPLRRQRGSSLALSDPAEATPNGPMAKPLHAFLPPVHFLIIPGHGWRAHTQHISSDVFQGCSPPISDAVTCVRFSCTCVSNKPVCTTTDVHPPTAERFSTPGIAIDRLLGGATGNKPPAVARDEQHQLDLKHSLHCQPPMRIEHLEVKMTCTSHELQPETSSRPPLLCISAPSSCFATERH